MSKCLSGDLTKLFAKSHRNPLRIRGQSALQYWSPPPPLWEVGVGHQVIRDPGWVSYFTCLDLTKISVWLLARYVGNSRATSM